MERLYTENVLIRYIYKESDFFERLEVEHAIEYEEDIRNIYIELCEVFDELPKLEFTPSENIIENILSFSRNTAFQA